jgi:hypothetical protein
MPSGVTHIILFHLDIFLTLVLGFYSDLSGRVRTVYLFSLGVVSLLSCRFTASHLPTSDDTTTDTFADDTAILVTHENPARASMKLQVTINKIDYWEKKWRNKLYQSKSTHITFALCNQTCPIVQMGNADIPQINWSSAKWIGIFKRAVA